MAKRPAQAELPHEMRRILRRLRWWIRSYVWLEGVSVAVVWLVLSFWIFLAIDYLPVLAGASEMPRTARIVLLGIVATVLGYILFRWILRRTFVRLGDRSMAILLERHFRQFHDSLVTAVELHGAEGAGPTRQMLDHTRAEALENLRSVRLDNVFNLRPLLLSLSGALVLTATVGVFYGLDDQALELGAKRLYLLKDVPWPRQAKIQMVGIETLDRPLGEDRSPVSHRTSFTDRSVKVARGSSVSLLVRADAGAKVVPETCTISYRTEAGDRGRVNMTRVGQIDDGFQLYRYDGKPFKGIFSDLRFDVVGFDYRLRDYELEVVDSPTIVAAELDCRFPDYMVDEELSLWLPRTVELTTGVQLPRGTTFEIRAETNKPLQSVQVYNPDTGQSSTLEPAEDSHGFIYQVPSLGDHLSLEVSLLDTDSVRSERPHRVYVSGIEDVAPVVDIGLQGVGSALTPDAILPVEGEILDDYGVDDSWVEVFVDDESPRKMNLELGRGGKVQTSLDFRQQRSVEGGLELEPTNKLNLVVKARDRHDLDGGPHTGVSDHFQLEVVTPGQLLAMLEARELGLRRRFEQIIEETSQTRDALVRVKSEGPEAAIERLKASSSGAEQEAEGEQKQQAKSPQAVVERAWSLRLLRAQQELLQTQKSARETLGVAASFLDIRQELIHNRVDSEDRKERLQDKIAEPLQQIGERRFPELEKHLQDLVEAIEEHVEQNSDSIEENPPVLAAAEQTIDEANQILVEMDVVLQNMLELESFNDLLDIVRSLIEDQEQLLGKTKQEQKKQVLELLE